MRVRHFVIKTPLCFLASLSDSVYITTQSDFCLLVAVRRLWDFQTAPVGSRVASVIFAIAAVNLISSYSQLGT